MTATELRRALPFLLVPLVLFLAGCGLLPLGFPGTGASPQPTGPATVGAEAISDQERAWRAAGVTSYTWELRFGCECILTGPVRITVVDGTATEVRTPQGPIALEKVQGMPLTVDDLYASAHRAIDGGGDVQSTWGVAPGVPAMMALDPVRNAIDDELTVTVTGFSPAP